MSLQNIFEKAVSASFTLGSVDGKVVEEMLNYLSSSLVENIEFIVAENSKDLERMSLSDPKYDRLRLDCERIESIAAEMINVAALSSPVGGVLEKRTRPNGMTLTKICVPLGVVGVIYEARPNVTADVFSIAIKSGNVVVLKGGSDAESTNIAIISIIKEALKRYNISEDVITLLPSTREAAAELITANRYVDLVIPRGSSSLINYVRDNATVPVIETGAGICHTYVHNSAKIDIARDVVDNAKTRRVSVCNALDTLLIDKCMASHLPFICDPLKDSNVVIYADDCGYNALKGCYPDHMLCRADDESFGREYLDYKMSLKCVDDITEAIDHIRRYSSRHSEAIIAEDEKTKNTFIRNVDAACVYTNVSTAFTDGAQFGLGAEIGISTQKLHARGPMALGELTTYKWIIEGDGQIRKR